MHGLSERVLQILGEIRGRMTLGERTHALNNELGRSSTPYTEDVVERALSTLVAQQRIAQIDDRPPAFMAIAAKVLQCPNKHEIPITYLLGAAETMQGVKCPTCGVVTLVSAGQIICLGK